MSAAEVVVTWDPPPADPARIRGAHVLDGLFLGHVYRKGGSIPWRACAKSDRETAHVTEANAMKACEKRLRVRAREHIYEQAQRADLDARLAAIEVPR